MLGTVNAKRAEELKGSNLYPIILDYISGTTSASVKNSATDNVDIGSLTNKDVLLLPDASNLETITSVQEAYLYQDVPLVALYPDSKDISVMSEFISVTLVSPVSNDGVTPLTNPHYEYVAAAHRFIGSYGGGNTFVLPMDHEDNYKEGLISDTFVSGDIVVTRKEGETQEDYLKLVATEGFKLNDEKSKLFLEVFNVFFNTIRTYSVTYLFEDWALSLDKKANNMEAEYMASVASLRAAAGEESGYAKLTAIAEGVTISHHDNVNKELSDYFQTYEKASVVDGTISYFLYECGFDDVKELREGWGPNGYATQKTGAIYVNHNTETDYTIVGFHSSKDKNGDPDPDFALPSIRIAAIGGVRIGASFNVGLTHSTSKTWEVSDYTITPAVYYEGNRRVAAWDLNVDWPEYQSDCYWKMADAFHDSVTLETESMWQIPAANRNTVSFYGQTDSIIGFCWAHKMPSQSASQYHVGVRHSGAERKLTLPVPPLTGIDGAIQSGGKEGKTYTAKLYCEEDWTATSNVSWLTIQTAQGPSCSDMEFNFTAEPNETGQDRLGYITIQPSSGKSAMIRFTQSAYDK